MTRTIKRIEEVEDGGKIIRTVYKVEQYFCGLTKKEWVDMNKEMLSQYTIEKRFD